MTDRKPSILRELLRLAAALAILATGGYYLAALLATDHSVGAWLVGAATLGGLACLYPRLADRPSVETDE